MTLRFLTYNIHSCIGRGGVFSPEATVKVLSSCDADFIVLQEVHEPGDAFIELLKERLPDYEIIEGPTMNRDECRFGNLMLSRFPVREKRLIDLSVPGYEPRGAIRILCEPQPDQWIQVTGTHLGLFARERMAQVEVLLAPGADLSRADATRVLFGDFNDWMPGSPFSKRLRKSYQGPTGRPPRTFPARFPMFALDSITVNHGGIIDRLWIPDTPASRTASDHLPLLGEIRI